MTLVFAYVKSYANAFLYANGPGVVFSGFLLLISISSAIVYLFARFHLVVLVSGFFAQSASVWYFVDAGIWDFLIPISSAKVVRFDFAWRKFFGLIKSLCVGFGLYPSNPKAGLWSKLSRISVTVIAPRSLVFVFSAQFFSCKFANYPVTDNGWWWPVSITVRSPTDPNIGLPVFRFPIRKLLVVDMISLAIYCLASFITARGLNRLCAIFGA